jgi:hypothetical protein
LIAASLTDGFKGDDGRYLARYHERYQPLFKVGRFLNIRGILRFAEMAESAVGNGGERGIRTLGTLARSTVFETAPFDHSGTSPRHFEINGSQVARNIDTVAAARKTGFRCFFMNVDLSVSAP